MKKIITFALAFFCILSAQAQTNSSDGTTYGRWLCQECYVALPGNTMGVADLTEESGFVQTNVLRFSTTSLTPGQTITICNGKNCITMTFVGGINWTGTGATKKDNQQGYKNGQINRVVSAGTGMPIGAFYSYETTYVFANSIYKILTGTVTVDQLDATQTGFGSALTGSVSSSFGYGADVVAGGADQFAAEFGGTGKGVCEDNSCTIMSD